MTSAVPTDASDEIDGAVAPVGADEAPGSAAWWERRFVRDAKRRPRADGLTIERIIATAISIVDREGLDTLTVRRLADELGTGSASLYRHVASRDELLVLMVDDVLGEVVLPSEHETGRAKVEQLATELRRVLMAHPNLLPALAASPLLGPNAMRGAQVGFVSMLEAGFEPAVAVPAYIALIDYVLGTVYFDNSRAGQMLADRRMDEVAVDVSGPNAHDAATIEAVTNAFGRLSVEDVFAFGLRTFLDGLEG